MAIRAASIWRAVTQPASSACRPKSPKETFAPRVARPRRRPRCCFLNLTFFGINMMRCLLSEALLRFPARLGFGHLALEDPHLHADDPVGRAAEGQTVMDVGFQCVERETPILVPLASRDLGTIETAAHPDLDSLRSET